MEKLISEELFKNVRTLENIELMKKFNPNLRLDVQNKDENIIEIYGEIDPWGYGLDYLNYKLSQFGKNADITILMNSIGGSLFEGIAMHNLLRMHKGKVTTKIIGIAASSSTIVASASDEIQIAPTATFMVHNSSVRIYGNSKELIETSEKLQRFDSTMANLYSEITGNSVDEIVKMMDAETYMIGKEAVDLGFVTKLIDFEKINEVENKAEISAHKIDLLLAKSGVSRTERRALLKDIKDKDMQNAIEDDTHNAVEKSNVTLF